MIRLDKFLADMGLGTRSQVKQYLKRGMVTVNQETEKRPERKVAVGTDTVCFQGSPVVYVEYEYYMLYKPAGCVSAVSDDHYKTVLSYIKEAARKDLFPVGRLDLDTEGLLFITNDGPLCHELLSPSRHVPKTYYVETAGEIPKQAVKLFAEGVEIGDAQPTRPGVLEILCAGAVSRAFLTITEGRYHQVKRMFDAIACPVRYLKRVSFGELKLDESLKPGEYRALTAAEVALLKKEIKHEKEKKNVADITGQKSSHL